MSEALNETLHNLVTQISSIRLKTELAMAKHPEVSELTEIVALADEAQSQLQEGMSLLRKPTE